MNESDRELLELAAKAAGYAVTSGLPPQWKRSANMDRIFWNPLQEDGDALRLAARLQMKTEVNGDHAWACPLSSEESGFSEVVKGDATKALRIAIVLAAAAIGKAM